MSGTFDPVTWCDTTASLVVEVERTDGEPLSAPVTVRLAGAASRTAATDGDPARAMFDALPAGRYTITLALAGDEAGFSIMNEGPLAVAVAEGEQTALRVDIEGDDAWELTEADTVHDETPDEGPDDDAEDAEDDWEIIEAAVPEEE